MIQRVLSSHPLCHGRKRSCHIPRQWGSSANSRMTVLPCQTTVTAPPESNRVRVSCHMVAVLIRALKLTRFSLPLFTESASFCPSPVASFGLLPLHTSPHGTAGPFQHCGPGLLTRLKDLCTARKECGIQPQGLWYILIAVYKPFQRSLISTVFRCRHHEDP